MNPIVDGLEAKYAGRVNVVWHDIDELATGEVVLKYKVRSIPTFVFLDSSSRVVNSLLGLQSPEALEKAFASLLK